MSNINGIWKQRILLQFHFHTNTEEKTLQQKLPDAATGGVL